MEQTGRRATLPWIVLLCATLAGVGVIVYTSAQFDAMPDPVPTHFGVTGQPDGWSEKSMSAMMVLPIMTLVVGVTMAGVSILTAHAKRGLPVSRFLAGLGLLVTTMLASISVASVQVALGQRQAIPQVILLIALAIFLYAMIGAVWLVVRYGRNAPSTNDVADNRHWKLGVIYVDRDDPSWLVERRFGFGYTVNFGNPRAVLTFAAFLATILGLAFWAILAST
jgi:uncharacterized membrane protein